MKLETLATLLRSGQVPALLTVPRALRPYYRVCFLGAAAANGLLRRLARGPASLDELAAGLSADPAIRDALAAWLDFGVALGELGAGPQGYRLRSRLARRLASPVNDAAAALIEEAARLHHAWVTGTPTRLVEGSLFSLAELDADLVARSSRVLEPFVGEAVDTCVPTAGAMRLLEVGCGSGIHMRRAAERNPELTAVGVELAPAAAALARRNVETWGLAARLAVEVGDIRARRPEPMFDLVTLHNNIYYFPPGERSMVLAHTRRFLRPGGRLLVTTACRGGSHTTELLNLWGAATEGCGRLPISSELETQLVAAGFSAVRAWRLIPGESFWAFVATSEAR